MREFGFDGTAVNTRKRKGFIFCYEKVLRRELQHSIYVLHTNEIPRRFLHFKLDGGTTAPKTFTETNLS